MTRLIRAEALHLRSLRSTSITALAIIALTTLITVGDFGDAGKAAMDTSKELLGSFMTTMVLVPAMGVALFAAARAAGEFRYDTIAHRALAAPQRSHVVMAKLAVLVPFAALVTTASIVCGLVAAGVVLTGSDPALHLPASAVAEMLAGSALFAGLGVAIGFLSRNQTAAVLVVFGGWVFEKVLEAVVGSAVFLPYGLLSALADQEALAGVALAVLTAGAVPASSSLLTRKDVV